MPAAKIEDLSREAFAPYGEFVNMINPATVVIGEKPVEFFRDMISLNLGSATAASFSICRVEKRPEVVDVTEFHSSCGEGTLPLDADILIHVAEATPNGEVPYDRIRIFRVPRGTMVCLKAGVWHHAPFLDDKSASAANVVIVLPERTYANDCEVVELEAAQQTTVQR